MTIHAEFWRSRQGVANPLVRLALGGVHPGWARARDSNRQRCYDWENETLRPHQSAYESRQAAKGFARLCSKIAIKKLEERGLVNEEQRSILVNSFKAAFTNERLGKCNANLVGAYFANWGWTDVIIAHEVAHWADQWARVLDPKRRTTAHEGHGPHWRGWFIHILSDAKPKLSEALLDDTATIMRRGLDERRLKYVLP